VGLANAARKNLKTAILNQPLVLNYFFENMYSYGPHPYPCHVFPEASGISLRTPGLKPRCGQSPGGVQGRRPWVAAGKPETEKGNL
jgi:hypothetical protein